MFCAALLAGSAAHAGPGHVTLLPDVAPLLLKDAPTLVLEPERVPRFRPLAWTAFGAAVVAAGVAGYFAYQSDNARGQLLALPRPPNPVPPSQLTQPQAERLYDTATQDGQIALGLLAGAGALAGVGAVTWWYGTRMAVAVQPAGLTVSGVF